MENFENRRDFFRGDSLNFSVFLASRVFGILPFKLAVCDLFRLFIQSNSQWGSRGGSFHFYFSCSGCMS